MVDLMVAIIAAGGFVLLGISLFYSISGFVVAHQWPQPRFLCWQSFKSDRQECCAGFGCCTRICCHTTGEKMASLYIINFSLGVVWALLTLISLYNVTQNGGTYLSLLVVVACAQFNWVAAFSLHRSFKRHGTPINWPGGRERSFNPAMAQQQLSQQQQLPIINMTSPTSTPSPAAGMQMVGMAYGRGMQPNLAWQGSPEVQGMSPQVQAQIFGQHVHQVRQHQQGPQYGSYYRGQGTGQPGSLVVGQNVVMGIPVGQQQQQVQGSQSGQSQAGLGQAYAQPIGGGQPAHSYGELYRPQPSGVESESLASQRSSIGWQRQQQYSTHLVNNWQADQERYLQQQSRQQQLDSRNSRSTIVSERQLDSRNSRSTIVSEGQVGGTALVEIVEDRTEQGGDTAEVYGQFSEADVQQQ